MPIFRKSLPQLQSDRPFVSDGGLETSLVFTEGLDLPCFAAFPLVETAEGRGALTRYFTPFLELAAQYGTGMILDTPTWRANTDWAARLGYDRKRLLVANRQAVAYAARLRADRAAEQGSVVISAVVGPRGDGYVVGDAMSADEAERYHAVQIDAFADTEADFISAVTMTSAAEATGIAKAARRARMPVVISFTVETDGRLPSGEAIGGAILAVDRASDEGPAYYMINCAHPRHFEAELAEDAPWLARIGGLRANASTKSHAELDASTVLDIGEPAALARDYATLRERLPGLRVLGGCCGTDHRHLGMICAACL